VVFLFVVGLVLIFCCLGIFWGWILEWWCVDYVGVIISFYGF